MTEVKKPRAQITISRIIDIESVTRYYKLQSASAAAPSKPTDDAAIPSGWTKTEPAYQNGATNRLYFVDQTIMTNGSIYYSQVSLSSSYEAAKEAWNKANNAQKTADTASSTANTAKTTADNASKAAKDISDNIYTANTTTIEGAKITTGSIKAEQIDVNTIFAEDVEATGTIKGAKITGAFGEFSKGFSVNVPCTEDGATKANMVIQNNGSKVTIGSKSPDATGIGCAVFTPGSAGMSGTTVEMSGKSVRITGSSGLMMNGADVSIEHGLGVGSDLRIGGSIYRNGYRIGETMTGSNTNAKAIANGTWTNTGASIKLHAGVYMVVGTVIYASAKGGRRGARFANGSNGLAYTSQVVSQDSSGSANAYIQCQWILTPDAETTYNLQAFQSTGAKLNVTASYIKAVRIA